MRIACGSAALPAGTTAPDGSTWATNGLTLDSDCISKSTRRGDYCRRVRIRRPRFRDGKSISGSGLRASSRPLPELRLKVGALLVRKPLSCSLSVQGPGSVRLPGTAFGCESCCCEAALCVARKTSAPDAPRAGPAELAHHDSSLPTYHAVCPMTLSSQHCRLGSLRTHHPRPTLFISFGKRRGRREEKGRNCFMNSRLNDPCSCQPSAEINSDTIKTCFQHLA